MTEPTEISKIFGASLIGTNPNAKSDDRSKREIPVEKPDLPRFRECMRYMRSMWQLPEITEDDGHVYGGLVSDIGMDNFEYALKSYARDTTLEHGRQRCVIKPTVTRLYVQYKEIEKRRQEEKDRRESINQSREWQEQAVTSERANIWMERVKLNQKNALIVKEEIRKTFNLKKNDNRWHNLTNEVFRVAQREKVGNKGWHEVNVDRYMELAKGLAPQYIKEK